MLDINPLDSLANLIIGIYKAKKVQQWLGLIFQITYSAIISFLSVTGTTLGTCIVTDKFSVAISWSIAIASGMVSAAVTMTYFFRKSPLTNGMMLVLPEQEANDEIKTNLQTIIKNK